MTAVDTVFHVDDQRRQELLDYASSAYSCLLVISLVDNERQRLNLGKIEPAFTWGAQSFYGVELI